MHFTSKSPHGRKDTSLFPSTRALICFATKCPHGQAVKTSPSHGGIWGSIPHGGTKNLHNLVQVFTSYFLLLTYSPPCLIAHSVCATLLPEPQNTGLALHYVSKLTRFRYFTIPHGGTKKALVLSAFSFFILHFSFTPMSHCTLCVHNFCAIIVSFNFTIEIYLHKC